MHAAIISFLSFAFGDAICRPWGHLFIIFDSLFSHREGPRYFIQDLVEVIFSVKIHFNLSNSRLSTNQHIFSLTSFTLSIAYIHHIHRIITSPHSHSSLALFPFHTHIHFITIIYIHSIHTTIHFHTSIPQLQHCKH